MMITSLLRKIEIPQPDIYIGNNNCHKPDRQRIKHKSQEGYLPACLFGNARRYDIGRSADKRAITSNMPREQETTIKA